MTGEADPVELSADALDHFVVAQLPDPVLVEVHGGRTDLADFKRSGLARNFTEEVILKVGKETLWQRAD